MLPATFLKFFNVYRMYSKNSIIASNTTKAFGK